MEGVRMNMPYGQIVVENAPRNGLNAEMENGNRAFRTILSWFRLVWNASSVTSGVLCFYWFVLSSCTFLASLQFALSVLVEDSGTVLAYYWPLE